MIKKLRIGVYGTKHAHATAKIITLKNNPKIEITGVFEPDINQRNLVQQLDKNYNNIYFYDFAEQLLNDPTIVAIASEGLNSESLNHTEAIVQAGKHCWYDKPAGDNLHQWRRIMRIAEEKKLHIQMGYMFRYHEGFSKIIDWARSGFLGDIFSVRAHMSTSIPTFRNDSINYNTQDTIANHKGGIFYDLGSHMLDPICWMLGCPDKITSFLRNDSGLVPQMIDNTLCVLEYSKAMAFIDIAAMEMRPMARRFEVYGSTGSAILVEPFEPSNIIRLCLGEPKGPYNQGVNIIELAPQNRGDLYEKELEAFIATICGEQLPDRPPSHELLVQETLLKSTNPDFDKEFSINQLIDQCK